MYEGLGACHELEFERRDLVQEASIGSDGRDSRAKLLGETVVDMI